MKKNRLKIKIVIIILVVSYCFIFSTSIRSVSATTARYKSNFDDVTHEGSYGVYKNDEFNYNHIAVTYDMGEGICIIRGVNYLYSSIGSVSSSVEIRFVGDIDFNSIIDSGIPVAGDTTSRSFLLGGPIYLLDDDPEIHFMGNEPVGDAIMFYGDSPSYGHSYYDSGFGWTLDNLVEHLVELVYEWIIDLNIDTAETGSITSNDNVDAYFMTLTAGNEYDFELERTSGSGDINMRVVTYQDLTNDNLAQSSGSSYPKSMSYTPSSSGTYVLLVEADIAFVDTADYSINYESGSSSGSAPNAPTNPNPSSGATGVSLNPTLSVDVSDPDGDVMNVYFYNSTDDSLIGVDSGVPSGGRASILWSGLSATTTNSWYASADDGSMTTQSPNYFFITTISSTWSSTVSGGGGGSVSSSDSGEAIPGYDLFIVVGIISVISTYFIKKKFLK